MIQNKGKTRGKKWLIKTPNEPNAVASIKEIANYLGISYVVAALLYTRGYNTPKLAKDFVYMENEMLLNPFEMKDMSLAIERIKRAVDTKEKITIFGDYDVDGVTSVCTLYLYLKSKGANVEYYIPNRIGEGYGVSKAAIDMLKENGTSLIITVDTGITANEEVEYAKGRGVDFVITDHHECRADIPLACAAVNPHRPDCAYPFKDLAGVGVVFKVVCAYEEKYANKSRAEATSYVVRNYADLIAIGTIADVMPIREENRIIVSFGLKMIENTERLGISALIEAASSKNEERRYDNKKKKTKITSGYIGFTLAPRINAAGRIRTASLAVELFLANTKERAAQIANELCQANKERQNEENKIMNLAYEKIEKMDIQNNPVIILDSDDWHHGVIGIVSSRITEKYCQPSILVSFEGNTPGYAMPDDVGKGSGRSIRGMNLVDALCYCSDLLSKFGGHELAAGLSVTRENLPLFRAKINEYARANLDKENMIPTLEADLEIPFSDITLPLAEGLQKLEPYGVGNPMPVFVAKNVSIVEIAPISQGKHTRLVVTDGKSSISCMYFSVNNRDLDIFVGDKVDIMFNLDINEWNGRRNAQIIVKDIKISDIQQKHNELEEMRFNEIWNGATFSKNENILPSRDDFAVFYKFILNSIRSGKSSFTHRDICSKLSIYKIGYIKLKVIIKVFFELNILGIEEFEDEHYRFSVRYSSVKHDLEKSTLLRKLRSQERI